MSQANPLIPSGISSTCSSFLTSLDTDTALASCASPLVNATADFGPSGNSTGTASASTISSALNNVCSSTTSCDQSTVRGLLASFYGNCTAELTSSVNSDVIRTYDVLYSLIPFKEAICSKDDSGRYCVSTLNTTSSAASTVRLAGSSSSGDSLYSSVSLSSKRDDQVAFVPNVTTYSSDNLLFLYLTAGLTSEQLCTTCTQEIMTAYMNFESSVAYAPGLANSPMLSGQTALYNGIQTTCGSTFLSGSVVAAGGSISSGLLDSAASARAQVGQVVVAGSMLGALAFGAVTLLL